MGANLPTEDDGHKAVEALNTAMRAHIKEIIGVPLTPDDIMARFIVYGSTLIRVYEFDAVSLGALLAIAAQVELTCQTIPTAQGNA
jgi:hypothetical protein